jgi:hypothetical protein
VVRDFFNRETSLIGRLRNAVHGGGREGRVAEGLPAEFGVHQNMGSYPQLHCAFQQSILETISKWFLYFACASASGTYLLRLAQLRSQQESGLHEDGSLAFNEEWSGLLDVQLEFTWNVIGITVQKIDLLRGSGKLIFAQTLKLRIKCRNRCTVALNSAEGDKDHTFLKMSHFNAASVVLKLDLVPDGTGVVICEGGVQV